MFGGMLVLRWKQCGDMLTIYLGGEIDHCAAKKLKNEIEKIIHQSNGKPIVLDFSDVTFMDSSGVGMLIGRYKTTSSCGGKLYASGLHISVERLYRMAGLHRIIPIIQDERKADA